MSVGKGSIIRAAQANDAVKDAAQENRPAAAAVKAETKSGTAAQAKKAAAGKTQHAKTEVKKAEVKKTEEVKPAEAVVRASVISSSDNIHEKKFEAVSHIYSELPVYLL